MNVSDFRSFEEVLPVERRDIARCVENATEQQKAEREADLLGPAIAGSLSLIAAGWYAGAVWPMLGVVAVRLAPDLAAQATARAMLARIASGLDIAKLKARAETIAFFTGAGWGLACWPIHDLIYVNLGALLVYMTVHVTAIMVAIMTAPSPDSFKRWIFGWSATMIAPSLHALDAASLTVAVSSIVFAGVLIWISQRLHLQLRRQLMLQIENEDLSREVGAVNRALAHSLALAERSARHDSLTGLANRRAFEEAVVMLPGNCGMDGLHLLLIDLDHFKKINDRFGHRSGDAVLAAASKVLALEMRAGECCARWGGEEFVALLLECDRKAAVDRAEALRSQISGLVIENCAPGMLPVTASIGIAAWHLAEPLDQVIARADMAMYAAKERGRDRVHYADSDSNGPRQSSQA